MLTILMILTVLTTPTIGTTGTIVMISESLIGLIVERECHGFAPTSRRAGRGEVHPSYPLVASAIERCQTYFGLHDRN